MNKKKTTMPPASAKPAAQPPAKRSRLKLVLLGLAPVVLGGAGFAGWTVYAGQTAEHEPEPDTLKVAAIPPEVAAESSFTHALALSVLVAPKCGAARVPALMAASDAEAREDGNLVNLSWLAAARRAAATTAISCDYLRAEVRSAEFRAAKLAEQKDGAPKGGH